MKKISAEIVADSINEFGNRITSYILTYPRFIHAELMTHRMFSRNSASSRAIPFKKMIQMLKEDPFIPIAWQKDHSGMQGAEYFTDEKDIIKLRTGWVNASYSAMGEAMWLNDYWGDKGSSVTKQLCNRLLEPFMWHTVLVTATEWNNFFELRCPKYRVSGKGNEIESTFLYKSKKDAIKDYPGTFDEPDLNWLQWSESGAEIHIQALAEAMWDSMNESIPKKLKAGEWHIPFGDKIGKIDHLSKEGNWHVNYVENQIKIAIARCARLSYMTFEGEIDYEKDIKLHDQLLASKHMSPFEHCAKTMNSEEYHSFVKGQINDQGCEMSSYEDGYSQEVWIPNEIQGWCNNFKGFIPYRYMIDGGK